MQDNGVVSWLLKEHKPRDSKIYHNQSKFGRGEVSRQFRNVRLEDDLDTFVERERFKEKKMLAEIFCAEGYEYECVAKIIQQKQLKIHMPRSKFISEMKGIMNQTFRNIEIFLQQDCERHIKPLNFGEMKQLYPIMLHCRTHTKLSQNQLSTLFKFIKATYGIDKLMILQGETIDLYSALFQAMKNSDSIEEIDPNRKKRKLKNRHPRNRRNQYEKYWNEDMVREMLTVYKRNHQMSRIKSYFEQVYPDKMVAFNRRNLKAKFLKVIRLAIVKAKKFAFEEAADRYRKIAFLGYFTIKSLLNQTFFLKTRGLLADIYLLDKLTLQNSGDKLQAINDSLIKYFQSDEQQTSTFKENQSSFQNQVSKSDFEINREYVERDNFTSQAFYEESSQDCDEENSCNDSVIDVDFDSE